jgi:hypothetical protein
MDRHRAGNDRALRCFFVLVAFGFLCALGGRPASAQTYDFTFNDGMGGTITSGVLTYAGGAPISVSGNANNLTFFGLSNGTFDWTSLLHNNSTPFYNSSSDYGLEVTHDSAPFVDAVEISLFPGADQAQVICYTTACGGLNDDVGTSTVDVVTPAPVPGTGLLSYIVFGIGGLWIKRGLLWSRSTAVLGLVRQRASAGSASPAPAQPSRRLA